MTQANEKLSDRAITLLTALRDKREGYPYGWLSRADLAHETGKNRLSPHDIILLDRMEQSGHIESEIQTSNAPSGWLWRYRAVVRDE